MLFPPGISAAGSTLARGGATNRCGEQEMNDKHRSGCGGVSRSIAAMFLYDVSHLIACVRPVAISPASSHLLTREGTARSTQPKRRIEMTRSKLTGSALIVAAVAAISIAGGTAGFAAQLPSYAARGFPISQVQAGLLGAADVREQSPASTAAASPHRLSVLTPHRKLTTAAAPTRTEAGRATR
jgi:hypothetical protein